MISLAALWDIVWNVFELEVVRLNTAAQMQVVNSVA